MWPDVEDPATQHPMSSRHIRIRKVYDEMKSQGKQVPQIKTAS
jgi:transaldolase